MDVEVVLDALDNADMNGREISNSISTARTLAESEGEKLKLEYLQTIVQIWREFNESLEALQKVEVAE